MTDTQIIQLMRNAHPGTTFVMAHVAPWARPEVNRVQCVDTMLEALTRLKKGDSIGAHSALMGMLQSMVDGGDAPDLIKSFI
jgi:hypothetical protein